MTAIVTPEAVPLELRQAGLGSRFCALMIDWLVQGALGFALLVAAIPLAADNAGVGIALFFVFLFLVLLGYPAAMETLWKGRTLGKAAMGLRVVTVEGAPIRFRHAAIRAALGLFDFYFTSGAGAVLCALLTEKGQRMGDLVAGTIVLRERTGLAAPAPAAFGVPPWLESYAVTLDVSALRTQDYQAVRSFLLRAPQLDPQVRHGLAVDLADPIVGRVRPAPPTGIHPAWFLICVAAVYQRRHAGAQTPGPPGYPPPPPPPAYEPATDEKAPIASAPPPPSPTPVAQTPVAPTPVAPSPPPREGGGFSAMD